MNMYKNEYGYHTPKLTKQLAELLKANNIPFEDESWHNDELDRLSVRIDEDWIMYLWVGDPDNEEEYQTNVIWLSHEHDSDKDVNEFFVGTFEEIVAIVEATLALKWLIKSSEPCV